MDIDRIRQETPGCSHVTHLNNAGASLMPKSVPQEMQRYLDLESTIGGYEASEVEVDSIQSFYTSASQLIKCKPSEIAFTNNATDSYNRALSSIPFQSGDVILTTSNDYSSNYIAFLSLQKRFGIRIERIADAASGEIDLDDLDRSMKKLNPRLVAVTHIPTNSGLVQPIDAIGGIIKSYDTVFLVDACQTLGQLDVDVQRIGCDFLSGTMRKWLRGPRGAGLLYISQKALGRGYEPLFPDMRGADWIGEWTYRPAKTARRFEDWEFAYALIQGSKKAIDYAMDIGMHTIEERNRLLRKYTEQKLGEILDVQLMDRGKEKCNIITFHSEGRDPKLIKGQLCEKNINVSITDRYSAVIDFDQKGIDWVIRVSPHYYNTTEEIDELWAALKKIL